MKVFDKISNKEIEIDDNINVYVQRRNLDNRVPYAKDFDLIKLKDAKTGDVVRTMLYKKGEEITELYKVL